MLFKPLIYNFEEIVYSQSNWSTENTTTASRLVLVITKFDFPISFIVIKRLVLPSLGARNICEAQCVVSNSPSDFHRNTTGKLSLFLF